MSALLVAVVIFVLGAVVYLVAPPKFDELGRVFALAGALAVTALLCGVFG